MSRRFLYSTFIIYCQNAHILQKEGHSNLLLLVQYKKLTSNHGPQTFVAVRLKFILAVVTYIYEWGRPGASQVTPRLLAVVRVQYM